MRNLATAKTLRNRALFHDYIKFLQDYLRGILGGVRLGCPLLTVCCQQNGTGCCIICTSQLSLWDSLILLY